LILALAPEAERRYRSPTLGIHNVWGAPNRPAGEPTGTDRDRGGSDMGLRWRVGYKCVFDRSPGGAGDRWSAMAARCARGVRVTEREHEGVQGLRSSEGRCWTEGE
jgi:hypothetical protein